MINYLFFRWPAWWWTSSSARIWARRCGVRGQRTPSPRSFTQTTWGGTARDGRCRLPPCRVLHGSLSGLQSLLHQVRADISICEPLFYLSLICFIKQKYSIGSILTPSFHHFFIGIQNRKWYNISCQMQTFKSFQFNYFKFNLNKS